MNVNALEFLDNNNENKNAEQDGKNLNHNNNNDNKRDKSTNKHSKFNGKNQHDFGNMNNKNDKKRLKQSTIMESMGARLREMVSEANTNDIHHPIKRPPIILPKDSSQKISLFYSDNYGFSKCKFYNPVIKDFNITFMGNFANIYRSGIDPNKQNHARDFRSAVIRSPTGKASIFIEGNIFIPFKCVTKDYVQLNVGDPIPKNQILSGLSNICGLLNRQNIDSNDWILGTKETRLFSIKSQNRMFKEKSYDLHPDFILNFGNFIRKKAWNKKDFDKTLEDLELSKYYFLTMDDENSYGIPICFTVVNDNYYAYLNKETKYVKIDKLQKILNDKDKTDKMKKINIMDWDNKFRLIVDDENKVLLNPILFKNFLSFDMSKLNLDKFIINAEYIGHFMVIIDKQKIYPIYILNQNYIRFNHCIVNIKQLYVFLDLQRLNHDNFIYKDENWKSNEAELFIEYNFSLHHIHNDKEYKNNKNKKRRPTTQTQETSKNNNRNKKKEVEKKNITIPDDAKDIVDKAMNNLKEKNKNDKNLVGNDKNHNVNEKQKSKIENKNENSDDEEELQV